MTSIRRGSFRFTGRGNVRTAHEAQDTLAVMERRLHAVGADADEVARFREVWNETDNWLIPKARLVAMSDTKLRALLVATREEHEFHTTTEPETPALEGLAGELAELRKANNGNPLNIADTREWVGTDRARAQAALAAEQAEPHPRATLVAFLEPLAW